MDEMLDRSMAEHERAQLLRWSQLTYAQRLEWLWQAKLFAQRAVAAAVARSDQSCAGDSATLGGRRAILATETATDRAIATLRWFAQAMEPTMPAVDTALPALRALLDDAGVAYRLVGGIAVVHHGYARTTRDLDVLLEPTADARLAPLLAGHGFARESRTRLRHLATGVAVGLRVAGDPRPRPGCPPYPEPRDVAASETDSTVIGLAALIEMKLHAGRHQDQADIVALLKPRSEGEYLRLEGALPAALRPDLHSLWRDACEERSWEV